MRSIREILRQKWQLGRSNRAVAQSAGVSVGAVSGALQRARAAGLTTWEAVAALSEDALTAMLYRRPAATARVRPHPDFALIHTERKPGVTLELLHLEYLEPGFPHRCRRWRRSARVGSVQRQLGCGHRCALDRRQRRAPWFPGLPRPEHQNEQVRIVEGVEQRHDAPRWPTHWRLSIRLGCFTSQPSIESSINRVVAACSMIAF
jgi:hypothetical protein